MRRTSRLLSAGLLCVVSATLVHQVEANHARFQRSCSLDEDHAQLLMNESSGNYYEIRTNDTFPSRFLHTVVQSANYSDSRGTPKWIEASPCTCFLSNHTNAYCPTFTASCENQAHSSTEPEDIRCLGTSPFRNVLRRIMFIGLLWVAGIVGLLLFSRYGIEISNLIISWFYPKYNHFLAHRIMTRKPEQALQMMIENIRFRRRMRRRRPGTDPEWRSEARAVRQLRLSRQLREPSKVQQPVALRLKVRVYKETEKVKDKYVRGNDSDDDDDEEVEFEECAICYQDLRTGDRVGDIPCGHVFHAGCLKQWCVRRNACPFCQRNDICEAQLSSPGAQNENAADEAGDVRSAV